MKFTNSNEEDRFSHYRMYGEGFSCLVGSYPFFCGADIISDFHYPIRFKDKTEGQFTRDVFCSLYEFWEKDYYWEDKEEIGISIDETTFGVFVVEAHPRLFYHADEHLYLPDTSIIGPYTNANSENEWKMMFVPMHPDYYSKWNQDRGPVSTKQDNSTPPKEEDFDTLF